MFSYATKKVDKDTKAVLLIKKNNPHKIKSQLKNISRNKNKEVETRLHNWQLRAREQPYQANQPYEWGKKNIKLNIFETKKQKMINK